MAIQGNLIVGQSGGPTAVINSTLLGVIEEAVAHSEIEGIYGMLHGIRGVFDEEFADLRRESKDTLAMLRHTPASALGTVRYKVRDAEYDRLIEVLKKWDIRYLFYIGGNDSADTSLKMYKAALERGYELHVIGVPKTIDNDLPVTDHCPGYGSAARFVASAVRDTAMDTEAMGSDGPVKLVEIMGRNAGWLAAAAALARQTEGDPPHLIYVPEHPIIAEQVVGDVSVVMHKHGYCVAAVSEGLLDAKTGKPFGEPLGPKQKDAFGHEVKGGVVDAMADAIMDGLELRARLDKPGYLQRACTALQSETDREEAYAVGRAAVQAAVAGQSGQMVTLVREPGAVYRVTTGLGPLEAIANVEHKLPPEYINARGNDVTRAFLNYARPLIGGPLPPSARLATVRAVRT
ncbi:MAG: 6-phosphofructokinase [Chloroflexota bacterium]